MNITDISEGYMDDNSILSVQSVSNITRTELGHLIIEANVPYNVYRIVDFQVHENMQNCGIGRKMLNDAIAKITELRTTNSFEKSIIYMYPYTKPYISETIIPMPMLYHIFEELGFTYTDKHPDKNRFDQKMILEI